MPDATTEVMHRTREWMSCFATTSGGAETEKNLLLVVAQAKTQPKKKNVKWCRLVGKILYCLWGAYLEFISKGSKNFALCFYLNSSLIFVQESS